jgi:hypothetical protein
MGYGARRRGTDTASYLRVVTGKPQKAKSGWDILNRRDSNRSPRMQFDSSATESNLAVESYCKVNKRCRDFLFAVRNKASSSAI